MIWRKDKPTEKVIVAKLTENFCHQKDSYTILRLANEPYQHYSEDGEEIPYAAIEKWASLKDELPAGLEEAACEYVEELEKKMEAETGSSFDDDVAYLLTRLFIAGAEWQKEKDVAKFSASLDKNMKHVVSSNYERGRKDMKEQMMEKAVGGRYMKDAGSVYVESWPLDIEPDSVKAGDEVRLLIIPEEK